MGGQWIAFQTIVIKEIRRFMRIWVQTVVPPMVVTTLYFIIFGNLIGSQIAPVEGHSYMDYIAPGIILMSIINNAYANVVSSFYGAKFQRYVEELLIAPISDWLILTGIVVGGVARGLVVGAAVTVVAMCFTDLQLHSPLVVIAVVLLTAILFSLGGFINAIYAKSFDDISIIPTFILTPLTYLGGIFYSIEMLPPFWQQVSLFNPILYMINAFRYGLLGVSDVSLAGAFAIISATIALLFGISVWLLHRGVGVRS